MPAINPNRATPAVTPHRPDIPASLVPGGGRLNPGVQHPAAPTSSHTPPALAQRAPQSSGAMTAPHRMAAVPPRKPLHTVHADRENLLQHPKPQRPSPVLQAPQWNGTAPQSSSPPVQRPAVATPYPTWDPFPSPVSPWSSSASTGVSTPASGGGAPLHRPGQPQEPAVAARPHATWNASTTSVASWGSTSTAVSSASSASSWASTGSTASSASTASTAASSISTGSKSSWRGLLSNLKKPFQFAQAPRPMVADIPLHIEHGPTLTATVDSRDVAAAMKELGRDEIDLATYLLYRRGSQGVPGSELRLSSEDPRQPGVYSYVEPRGYGFEGHTYTGLTAANDQFQRVVERAKKQLASEGAAAVGEQRPARAVVAEYRGRYVGPGGGSMVLNIDFGDVARAKAETGNSSMNITAYLQHRQHQGQLLVNINGLDRPIRELDLRQFRLDYMEAANADFNRKAGNPGA